MRIIARHVALACSLVLAAVFLVAAVPKLLHPHDFALMIFRYHILPHSMVNLAAIFLPWLEVVAALALLIPSFRRSAALILLAMLAVFTAAISFNLTRGLNIACGCFSVDPNASPIGWWKVAENAGLMLLALFSAMPIANRAD